MRVDDVAGNIWVAPTVCAMAARRSTASLLPTISLILVGRYFSTHGSVLLPLLLLIAREGVRGCGCGRCGGGGGTLVFAAAGAHRDACALMLPF